MRFLIEAACALSKEFIVKQGTRPILLTYRSYPYQQNGEIFYWDDFESFEDLGTFLNNYDGHVLLYQDGRELANNRYCGVEEWPEELQQPFMGLYLDSIGF